MRRFRFVGDPEKYQWDEKPVSDQVYTETFTGKIKCENWESKPLSDWTDPILSADWQEVFDEPKPLHKDTDLGYYMLELLKIRMGSRPHPFINFDEDVNDSIQKSKELIKQLNEETK